MTRKSFYVLGQGRYCVTFPRHILKQVIFMGVTWMSSHIWEERDAVLVSKHHGNQKSEMARMFHERRIKNIA